MRTSALRRRRASGSRGSGSSTSRPPRGSSSSWPAPPGNIAAGEEIRNLTRAEAERLRLPHFDFWLFDSKILARFAFDEDDTTLGVHVTEDPAEVLAARQARDAAWHHSVGTEDFARRVRSTV